MILYVLRGVFVLLVTAVAALYVLSYQNQKEVGSFAAIAAMLAAAVIVAGVVIGLDAITRKKKLSSLSGIFLGLIAGLLAAFALSFVVDLVALLWLPDVSVDAPTISEVKYDQLSTDGKNRIDRQRAQHQRQVNQRQAYLNLFEGVKVVFGLITCYLGISLVLQTKDDFRFVFPYVEFSREVRGNRPTLVDTSVLVDGRIVKVLETKVVQGTLIVPSFVLEELQLIADSSEKLKRSRGRRGLDVLKQLQDDNPAQVRVEEHVAEGADVDHKLLDLGQQLQARVMTDDYNLNKVAAVRGVDVVNLNDLAKALKPVVLPGEPLEAKIVKSGEGASQGVAYLEDGTMVVVEGGRDHIGKRASIVVTSTLQTSAGQMIFGRYDGQVGAEALPSTEPRAVGGGSSSVSSVSKDPAESREASSRRSTSSSASSPSASSTPQTSQTRGSASGPSRRNPRRS